MLSIKGIGWLSMDVDCFCVDTRARQPPQFLESPFTQRASSNRGEQMKTLLWLLIGMLSVAPALAQWEKVPDSNIPRTRDGKPNLSSPTPRTPDGKPDLSGMWWMPNPGPANTGVPPKYLNNISADLKPEDVPMQPWAAELFKQRGATFSKDFPYTRCLPSGPMITSFP